MSDDDLVEVGGIGDEPSLGGQVRDAAELLYTGLEPALGLETRQRSLRRKILALITDPNFLEEDPGDFLRVHRSTIESLRGNDEVRDRLFDIVEESGDLVTRILAVRMLGFVGGDFSVVAFLDGYKDETSEEWLGAGRNLGAESVIALRRLCSRETLGLMVDDLEEKIQGDQDFNARQFGLGISRYRGYMPRGFESERDENIERLVRLFFIEPAPGVLENSDLGFLCVGVEDFLLDSLTIVLGNLALSGERINDRAELREQVRDRGWQ